MSHFFQCSFGILIILFMQVTAQAIELTPGTYQIEGGDYRVQVQMQGNELVVVEPTRTSNYALKSDGSFHYYNENNNTVYGFRVVNHKTLEAFKPNLSHVKPTRLVLVAQQAAPLVGPNPEQDDAISAVARKYEALAKSDPVNAMTWTSCAAAAQARATSNDTQFVEYAKMVVSMLKPISTSPAYTPCEDAIPQSVWQGV